jgi:carboxypeptidase C (cathepsin A)
MPRLSPWRITVALTDRIEESLARMAGERHPRETFFDSIDPISPSMTWHGWLLGPSRAGLKRHISAAVRCKPGGSVVCARAKPRVRTLLEKRYAVNSNVRYFLCLQAVFFLCGGAAAQSQFSGSLQEVEAVTRSYFGEAIAERLFKDLEPLRPVMPTAVSHTLELAGRKLSFTAEAGSVPLSDTAGTPIADVRYFAYLLDHPDVRTRPVTFAMNGGPGVPSVWLHLGGLGPWRLPVTQGERSSPALGAKLVPNTETWLDFTDLVFIDAVGTGYSRLARDDKRTRSTFFSFEGDIATLAVFVRRWLDAHNRTLSPKVFVGESYSGVRAPFLADILASNPGARFNAVILVSPAISANLPQSGEKGKVGWLPTVASILAERQGRFALDLLPVYERYARGPYLADLSTPASDDAATERLVRSLAQITNIDVEEIRRTGARRAPYAFKDSTGPYAFVDSMPPYAFAAVRDPLESVAQPVIAALAREAFAAPNEHPYHLRSSWGWDHRGKSGRKPFELFARLLDTHPNLRVMVTHGAMDTITPYFQSKLDFEGLVQERFGHDLGQEHLARLAALADDRQLR